MMIARNLGQIWWRFMLHHAPPNAPTDAAQQMRAFEISSLLAFFSVKSRQKFVPNVLFPAVKREDTISSCKKVRATFKVTNQNIQCTYRQQAPVNIQSTPFLIHPLKILN